jgi:hypothetical protein
MAGWGDGAWGDMAWGAGAASLTLFHSVATVTFHATSPSLLYAARVIDPTVIHMPRPVKHTPLIFKTGSP